MPQSWFSFKNSADNKRVEISIYDVIGSYAVSAKSFISELKRAGGKDIDLRIHSPGGNILEGNAIYNALDRHTGNINVYIDGIAASMASVIAMVGDTIEIAENGMVMIHNPQGYVGGDSKDLKKYAEVMDKMKSGIVAAYQKKTGLSAEKISQMMDDETWFTSTEALENKFVDFIGKAVDAKNSFDLSTFKNAPRIDTPTAEQAAAQISSMATETPEAKITRLEGELTNFKTEKATLTTRAETAEAKVTTLEGEKTALITRAETAETKVTALESDKTALTNEVATLKGEAKDAGQRAREIAAASGVQAAAKGAGVTTEGTADGKALYEQYDKLMTEGKSAEAAEFYEKHEKAIEAYGQSTLKKD